MRIKQTVTRLHSCLWLLVVLAEMACGAAPASDQTIYTSTSNQALKQKALQIVQSIRALVDAYNKQTRNSWPPMIRKTSPSSRQRQEGTARPMAQRLRCRPRGSHALL